MPHHKPKEEDKPPPMLRATCFRILSASTKGHIQTPHGNCVTLFSSDPQTGWLPSDVPMVQTSSALTYCAAEQGLFPTCRRVAGVIGAEAFFCGAAGPPR